MSNYLSVLGSPRAGRVSPIFDGIDSIFNDPFFSWGKTSFSDDKVRFNTTNKQFTCEIDLPGVKKQDLKITQEDNQIFINASRKVTSSGGSKEENYTRSFSFDNHKFNVNTLNAKLENGVLTISILAKEIPKKEVKEIKVS